MKLVNIRAWSIVALAVCALPFLQTSAKAADVAKTNRADISKFDLYGVRLGMSEADAYSALHARFGDSVTRDAHESVDMVCATEPDMRVCAEVIKSDAPEWRAQVDKVEVDYTKPISVAGLLKQLTAKYGQPTSGEHTEGYKDMWGYVTKWGWDVDRPSLEFDSGRGVGAYLRLSNERGMEKVRKRLEDQRRPTPKL